MSAKICSSYLQLQLQLPLDGQGGPERYCVAAGVIIAIIFLVTLMSGGVCVAWHGRSRAKARKLADEVLASIFL